MPIRRPLAHLTAMTVAAAVLCLSAGTRIALGQCDGAPTKVSASPGAPGEQFGSSVAVSGDIAVFGLPQDGDNGMSSGSAYVFRSNGSAWIQEQKLLPSDGATFDRFGTSVTVSGGVAVIGASNEDANGTDAGAAYVFRFNGATWIQEEKLLAADGAAYDYFGTSVSLSDDIAVIGASGNDDDGSLSGSAYVFRYNGSAWVQESKLSASDGAAFDRFGRSVAVSNATAIIGAFGDSDNGASSGSAYVFGFNGSSWTQEQKLLASDGQPNEEFGQAVAISGDLAVVGVYKDDDNGVLSGSAYVFRFDGSGWAEESKLLPSDGAPGDKFGYSVSASGNTVVVGAHLYDDDVIADRGSAYVFHRIGSMWMEDTKLLAPDGWFWDFFGFSVAVSGSSVVVGSVQDDDEGLDSGSAYVFECAPVASGCSFDSDCDDSNECTADYCNSGTCANFQTDCDDGDACTVDSCEPASGCRYNPITCSDADACTVDSCEPGTGCVYDPISCPAGESCVNGQCEPDGCVFNSDCDDSNACTADVCSSGSCSNFPINCNDGNACTIDTCFASSGCSHSAVTCNDGDACTIDSCDPASGCAYDPMNCPAGESCVAGQCEPDGCVFNSDCNDFNACTTDTCNSGTCSNWAISCNDGNACTVDSCEPASGCRYDPISCPAGESCVNGACEPSSGCNVNSDCDDSNACTWDVCTSVGTCWHPAVICNDSNLCTEDSCNPQTGCLYEPMVCPGGQTCVDGSCTSADGCTFHSDCDDFDDCTADLCNSGTCSNTPFDCDDGNACTTDSCFGGTCFHDPLDCDDADACTIDTCNGGGCSNTPIDCDDGDACTTDSCSNGFCYSDPISCDDGDACTDDFCFGGACENTYAECGSADGCCGPSCDGGNDPDCSSCLPSGSSCTDNSDCCSNKCRGKNGNKTCKGG